MQTIIGQKFCRGQKFRLTPDPDPGMKYVSFLKSLIGKS